MKNERVTIEIVCFRDDGDGSKDMVAVWKNLCDALYQINGVEKVDLLEREATSDNKAAPFKPTFRAYEGGWLVRWGEKDDGSLAFYDDAEEAAVDFGERYAAWKAAQR